MRFSQYPEGYKFVVSAENPQIFSADDIVRYIELDNIFCRGNQEQAEWIRLRRSLAKQADCMDCIIEVNGNELHINLL